MTRETKMRLHGTYGFLQGLKYNGQYVPNDVIQPLHEVLYPTPKWMKEDEKKCENKVNVTSQAMADEFAGRN